MPMGVWLTTWRWMLLLLKVSLKPRDRMLLAEAELQAHNDKSFVIQTLIHLEGGVRRITFCIESYNTMAF